MSGTCCDDDSLLTLPASRAPLERPVGSNYISECVKHVANRGKLPISPESSLASSPSALSWTQGMLAVCVAVYGRRPT